MQITIAGNNVSTDELQGDIVAARKKGYNYTNDFAFTCATVQGLLDKIEELSQMVVLLHVFTKPQPSTHKAKCILKKYIPFGMIPKKGDYVCVSEGFCLELVNSVHISYEPKLHVEIQVDTIDEYNEYKTFDI